MTGYQKKRILGIFAPLTAFILAIALMFTLLPVTAFADDTATDDDGTKDVTYTDEFSYDSAADWTTSQGYTATIGNAGNDAAISGLLVDTLALNPNTGEFIDETGNIKTMINQTAMFYTKLLEAPYSIELGIYYASENASGPFGIALGSDSLTNNYAASDTAAHNDGFTVSYQGVSKHGWAGNESYRTTFTSGSMLGKEVRVVINVTDETTAAVEVYDAVTGADLLPQEHSLDFKDGVTANDKGYTDTDGYNGYFGFYVDSWISSESIITYAKITDDSNAVVYDDFSTYDTFATTQQDGGTFSPIDPSESDKLWVIKSASGAYEVSRYMRLMRGNELVLGNLGATNELVWIEDAAKMTGGVGAEYTVKFDYRNMANTWNSDANLMPSLAFVLNADTSVLTAGVAERSVSVAGSRTQFPALVYENDGLQVGIIGTGNEVKELEEAKISTDVYGDLYNVTVRMEQTGESVTKVSVDYFNSRNGNTYAGVYEVAQPINGYFAMIAKNSMVISGFRMYDKDDALIAASEFEGINVTTADRSKKIESTDSEFAWYIGTETNSITVFNEWGNATANKALVIHDRAGESNVFSYNAVVTEVVDGYTPREVMFEAQFDVSKASLNGGSFSFVFGGGQGSLSFDGTNVTAKHGSDTVGSAAAFALADSTAVRVVAESAGTLSVYAGESQTAALTADYSAYGANVFAGSVGFSAGGSAVVRVDSFELTMKGIRDYAVLEVTPRSVVSVGEKTDFMPDAYSDAVDDQSALSLVITLVPEEGDLVVIYGGSSDGDGSYTFTDKGNWTVNYELTNTAGLVTRDSYSFLVRYMGTGEDKVDVLRNNFENGLGDAWTSQGTVSAAGGAVTLAASSSVETVGTMPYFIMYFTVDSLDGSDFEITFGNCHDYENAFGIIFHSGENYVTLRNLKEETAAIEGNFDIFAQDGAQIKVVVLGNTVTVSARAANGPYDDLSKAIVTAEFAENLGMTYGKIGFRTAEETTAKLSDVRLYSLDASIDIDPDNAPPEEPETPPATEDPDEGGLPGWAIALIVVGAVVVVAAVVVAVVFVRKKGKKNEKN